MRFIIFHKRQTSNEKWNVKIFHDSKNNLTCKHRIKKKEKEEMHASNSNTKSS